MDQDVEIIRTNPQIRQNSVLSHIPAEIAERSSGGLTGRDRDRNRTGLCNKIPFPHALPLSIQPKLAVSRPDDPYEQEADRMAGQMMRTPEHAVQRTSACQLSKGPGCGDEDERRSGIRIQRKVSAQSLRSEEIPPGVHDVLQSPGEPLDASARSFFEQRFGYDFSRVRVHTGTQAAESARAVDALAYTYGHHVVFNYGQYSPRTSDGLKLLGHEMTHVVQQDYRSTLFPGTKGSTAAPPLATKSPLVQRLVSPVACSFAKIRSVNTDAYRARGMLMIASGKLLAYSSSAGLWPSSVRTAMHRHFGTTLPGFATVLSAAAVSLAATTQALSLSTAYACRNTGNYPCTNNTLAWAAWCLPGIPIVLCDPDYFSQTALERSTTLIHEWTHKFWCRLDIGYEHEPGYPQNLFTASVNADNFSSLVRDLN